MKLAGPLLGKITTQVQQLDLTTHSVCGTEALKVWQRPITHENGGLLGAQNEDAGTNILIMVRSSATCAAINSCSTPNAPSMATPMLKQEPPKNG
ncbi:MAG: hypothetical protein KatS3mg009_0860 [Acidimicrobiia bacterium]|nr:MAG: hypothetical protein KatS3mg009_0860 [Acidimicrobiia bacterium]